MVDFDGISRCSIVLACLFVTVALHSGWTGTRSTGSKLVFLLLQPARLEYENVTIINEHTINNQISSRKKSQTYQSSNRIMDLEFESELYREYLAKFFDVQEEFVDAKIVTLSKDEEKPIISSPHGCQGKTGNCGAETKQAKQCVHGKENDKSSAAPKHGSKNTKTDCYPDDSDRDSKTDKFVECIRQVEEELDCRKLERKDYNLNVAAYAFATLALISALAASCIRASQTENRMLEFTSAGLCFVCLLFTIIALGTAGDFIARKFKDQSTKYENELGERVRSAFDAVGTGTKDLPDKMSEGDAKARIKEEYGDQQDILDERLTKFNEQLDKDKKALDEQYGEVIYAGPILAAFGMIFALVAGITAILDAVMK